jgi:hypothetical protein
MTKALHRFPTARDLWEIPRPLGHLLNAGLSGYDVLSVLVMRIILLIAPEGLPTALCLWACHVFYCCHIMSFADTIGTLASGVVKELQRCDTAESLPPDRRQESSLEMSEDDSDFEDVLEAERSNKHLISRRCVFLRKSADADRDMRP